MILPKTDLEKQKTATGWIIPRPRGTRRESRKNKIRRNSDDFGLRILVIKETFHTESATSIVACVLMNYSKPHTKKVISGKLKVLPDEPSNDLLRYTRKEVATKEGNFNDLGLRSSVITENISAQKWYTLIPIS